MFLSELVQFRNEIFHDTAAVIWKQVLSGVYVEQLGFKFYTSSQYGGEDVDKVHVRPSTTHKLFAVLAEKAHRRTAQFGFIFTKAIPKLQRCPSF